MINLESRVPHWRAISKRLDRNDRKIVAIDPATGAITPVVESGLFAPVDSAVDKQGDIYISERTHKFV